MNFDPSEILKTLKFENDSISRKINFKGLNFP